MGCWLAIYHFEALDSSRNPVVGQLSLANQPWQLKLVSCGASNGKVKLLSSLRIWWLWLLVGNAFSK